MLNFSAGSSSISLPKFSNPHSRALPFERGWRIRVKGWDGGCRMADAGCQMQDGGGGGEAIEMRDIFKRKLAGDPQRGQQFQVELGFVEVGVPAGNAQEFVAGEPGEGPPGSGNTQRDARLFRRLTDLLYREYMDDEIGLKGCKMQDAGCRIGGDRAPIHEFIHKPAGFDHRTGVTAAEKDDVTVWELLFQHAGHREGEHHIPDAVGPAEEDAHQSRIAWIPGSDLPSIYSSMAPPPVET